jgi:DMSO/TMAO reductase YedYZ heme-binding membrane subunit
MSQAAPAFDDAAVPSTAVVDAASRGWRFALPHVAARGVAVWTLRSLLLAPLVFMLPELVSAVQGRPNAMANISTSTADVLGTSSLLILVMMLSVTPIHTLTGWRWHLVLRRDYGVAMFFVAATDLALAAIATGNTFPGGVLARLGGHTFLVAGTLSVALLVPLALTANRRAQRWLGGHWKSVQRLTYVVWVTVLVHLAFLFGLSSIFLEALAVSAPLAVLRIPAVRRWWRSSRKNGSRRVTRAALAVVLIGVFAAGYVPLVSELAGKGAAAFVQQPSDT